MTQIVLPWPPRELSPNARIHHQAKAKVAKGYRCSAYWLTEQAGAYVPDDGQEVMVRMEFHPPDRRARDLDNMFASTKAALDGIADALQVDDSRFAFQIHRRAPIKSGCVLVTVEAV